MSNDAWGDLERIFAEARELPPGDRRAFVARACAADDAMHQAVLGLLAGDEARPDFMQNAANNEFTDQEASRLRQYLLKGGFLWMDDNWDPDFDFIRPNLERILPGYQIVDLSLDYPMFSVLYKLSRLPQIPSINGYFRTRQDYEFGPSTVHYYGMSDDRGRLMVLVSMNSDVSDSWEREGDNQEYFVRYSPSGYALGVDVVVWMLTH